MVNLVPHGSNCSVQITPFLHNNYFGIQLRDPLIRLRGNFIEKLKTYPNYRLFLSVLDQFFIIHLNKFCCDKWLNKNYCFLSEAQRAELDEFDRTILGFIWVKPCEFNTDFLYLEFIGSFLHREAQFTKLVMELFPIYLLPREVVSLSQEKYFLALTFHFLNECDIMEQVIHSYHKESKEFQEASPFFEAFERLWRFSNQDDWPEMDYDEFEKLVLKNFFENHYEPKIN